MNLRATIGLIVAVAFLISQSLGVAAHCYTLGDAAGHEHFAGAVGDHGDAIGAVSHDHATAEAHAHSKPDDPVQDFSVDLLAGDCSSGCVGVGPDTASVTHALNPGESLNPHAYSIPSAAPLELPTPPPNSIL